VGTAGATVAPAPEFRKKEIAAMATNDLRDLYIEQVQDMHSACRQSEEITRKMAEVAEAEDLKKALERGVEGIARGRDTMAQLARAHGAEPGGEHCKGMEGLVKEARKDVLEERFTDPDTRDAAIIAQYQRMAHYAIAGYGTIRAFAKRLKLDADAEAAQECLDKSYDGDRVFTDIATGHVNRDAA
jgi:ferritin-like metal-binding protein YciE